MKQPDQSIQDEKISGLLHDAADLQTLSSAEVLRRFAAMEGRMGVVEDIAVDLQVAVEDNTKLTATIATDTSELLDLFKSVKGGFKVMGWLGVFAKWVVGVLAAFAAIYAAVQNIRGVK